MVVGLLTLELQLPGCDTLKEKRHRLKGVIERARARFNVSAAEVDLQNARDSAVVAVSMVNSERSLVEKVLTKVEELFDNGDGILITASTFEWL